ncbi:MAG TPA: tetratricopeptide repeat protein [Pyrinomonadaceae bacterium]|nr:tetratricopeptide repeat protein [Pyrinomonadaceae bacterium]
MLKRLLIILSLVALFIVIAEPQRSTNSMLMTEAEIATLDAVDVAATEDAAKSDSRGNAFVRVIKAPFKAIGRLFGGGKRKDDNKFHRLTEKDVKKFKSAPNPRLINVSNAGKPAGETAALPDGDAKTHVERGRSFLNKGQLNEAIGELSKAASLDEKLAEAHSLLGVAYQFKGLPDWARREFEVAVKLDKKNAQILNNYGYLLYVTGEYKEALEQLSKAEKLAPEDARILNNLAMAQSQLGKYGDAYRNFVRAGGEVYGRLNIANRLQLAGRTGEAIKYFEAAKLTAENEKKEDPNAQAITVLLEIKNGKITFASVPDRRPGLETYEATALRFARRLKYPSDKTGPESVVVRVSPTPGS